MGSPAVAACIRGASILVGGSVLDDSVYVLDEPTPDAAAVRVELVPGGVRVDGERVAVASDAAPRAVALGVVARMASGLGRAVLVEAVDLDGWVWPLVVMPGGEVMEAGPAWRKSLIVDFPVSPEARGSDGADRLEAL